MLTSRSIGHPLTLVLGIAMVVAFLMPCVCSVGLAMETDRAGSSHECNCAHNPDNSNSQNDDESCCCGCSSADPNPDPDYQEASIAAIIVDTRDIHTVASSLVLPVVHIKYVDWLVAFLRDFEAHETLHHDNIPYYPSLPLNSSHLYLELAVLRL